MKVLELNIGAFLGPQLKVASLFLQLPLSAIVNLTRGNHYSEEQGELFGQYIAEFVVKNNRKLQHDDIMNAIELFHECTHR